jgi:hypothetical protein
MVCTMTQWCNERQASKGKKKISMDKLCHVNFPCLFVLALYFIILICNQMQWLAIIHCITVALLSHFLQNAAKVAAPIGTRALGKNAARTKASMKTKSYNVDKPDKFAMH